MRYAELHKYKPEINLNNVCITGCRTISILKWLMKEPLSEKEISEKIYEAESNRISSDSTGLYIKTLRQLGCIIERPINQNNYKYILKSHPFGFFLKKDEINTLNTLRENLYNLDDWQFVIAFELALKNLLQNISDKSDKVFSENANVMSTLLRTDLEVINELKKLYKGQLVILNYNSPTSKSKMIKFIIDKFLFENGALYLCGYNMDKEENQCLRADRILQATPVPIQKKPFKTSSISVSYKLTGNARNNYIQSSIDEIIEENDDFIIIRSTFINKFRMTQKILNYANECEVIEPEKIRLTIKRKLQEMLKNYERLS